MEIIQERLEREYNLDLVTTAPSVEYKFELVTGETVTVDNPTNYPDPATIAVAMEPIADVNIYSPSEFVGAIMGLLKRYLLEAVDTMAKDHIRLRFFGDMGPIAPELQALAHKTDEISDQLAPGDFQANICLNYGGRDEILRAVRQFTQDCAEGKRNPDELDDALFSTYMDSAGIPDPELIIRPSGELRLSNFLLWQCAYSEFYFTDVLWPDFDEAELDKAIDSYRTRDRRFGGVKK
jgi:undecaprenyl diphosphate synthase